MTEANKSSRKPEIWRECASCESHACAQSRTNIHREWILRALLLPTRRHSLRITRKVSPPRVVTVHLSDPQELNSSPHHLVATTTRTFHPTVNAWRLSQGSPRMLNVEQPPHPPLDTHFCGFPSLFGLMSQSRGLGVKAHGMHHGGYTASHTHGIADGTGSANGQRGSIHVEGAADCHFDFFFLTDTAIPLVSGAGTPPPPFIL